MNALLLLAHHRADKATVEYILFAIGTSAVIAVAGLLLIGAAYAKWGPK